MPLAKKSYGQHFLKDESVLEKIVEVAQIEAWDVVVEIGPGTGALTTYLEPFASFWADTRSPLEERIPNLILIEADRDLIPALERKFPKAKIIHADAGTVDYGIVLEGSIPAFAEELRTGRLGSTLTPRSWVMVGNLPYNAGNAIVMNALTSSHPPRRMVVMLQKEVGDRMLALATPPNPLFVRGGGAVTGDRGAVGVLSVAVALYAQVERVLAVGPEAFSPPPKVDSVVLVLTPIASDVDKEGVIALAKLGFANRRKQLHKNLAEAGISASENIKEILKSFGLSEMARAEELSLEQWIELSTRLSK